MSVFMRHVLGITLVRRLTAAVVRGLVDAENAVHLITWPYPSTARDVPVELSICLVGGAHHPQNPVISG